MLFLAKSMHMKTRAFVLLLIVVGAYAISSCTPFAYGTAGRFTIYDETTPADSN